MGVHDRREEVKRLLHRAFIPAANEALAGLEKVNGDLVAFVQRCGKNEEAHGVMKDDLAAGKLPSGLFGVNAAWWGIAVLAFNLNSAMKRLVLVRSGSASGSRLSVLPSTESC